MDWKKFENFFVRDQQSHCQGFDCWYLIVPGRRQQVAHTASAREQDTDHHALIRRNSRRAAQHDDGKHTAEWQDTGCAVDGRAADGSTQWAVTLLGL